MTRLSSVLKEKSILGIYLRKCHFCILGCLKRNVNFSLGDERGDTFDISLTSIIVKKMAKSNFFLI